MVRRFVFLASLILIGTAGFGQLGKYNILSIPDSLRKGADAVVRENDLLFTVKDMATATEKVHYAVTVVNEKDKQDLVFFSGNDKFHYLDEAEINVYDAMGNRVKTYTKKDMQTEAFGQGLVEDGKTTYFMVTAPSYPITVEENYTVKYKGILNYPGYLIAGFGHSVQSGSFEVVVPNELGLRYKAMNTTLKPQVENDGQKTTYKWSASNIKAQARELYSGPSYQYLPHIVLGANKFQMDNYQGDFTSWKNYGIWYNKLYGDDVRLSAKGAAFVNDLVKDKTNDIDKAKAIYRYMQQNMRYISIQLGIGGWKPFPADFVQEKKYGDCKALSNYMQAALFAVGIKSYSAIVKAGTNEHSVDEDFPENGFNHAILCIPQPKDSIWLECTSKYSDFGELGDFTENRKALLVTENGGVLVSTPASKATENVFKCRTDIMLNADGGGKATANLLGSGEYKYQQVGWMYQKTDDEKRGYLIRDVEWKQPDVLNITNGNRSETPYRTTATMAYDQLYSFKAGSKMFLPMRMYPIFTASVPDNSKRKHDYYFDHPYQLFDTTAYHLPDGFGVESLPKDKSLETPFGKYNSHASFDEATKTVTIIAFLEIGKHVVPAAMYPQLVAFAKSIGEDMAEKLVVKGN